MKIEEALNYADEWAKSQTFYEGMQGWRVVCAVLAAEVRRLLAEKAEIIERVEKMLDALTPLKTHADTIEYNALNEVLQILRGE